MKAAPGTPEGMKTRLIANEVNKTRKDKNLTEGIKLSSLRPFQCVVDAGKHRESEKGRVTSPVGYLSIME
jgi:hypothetical protein